MKKGKNFIAAAALAGTVALSSCSNKAVENDRNTDKNVDAVEMVEKKDKKILSREEIIQSSLDECEEKGCCPDSVISHRDQVLAARDGTAFKSWASKQGGLNQSKLDTLEFSNTRAEFYKRIKSEGIKGEKYDESYLHKYYLSDDGETIYTTRYVNDNKADTTKYSMYETDKLTDDDLQIATKAAKSKIKSLHEKKEKEQ